MSNDEQLFMCIFRQEAIPMPQTIVSFLFRRNLSRTRFTIALALLIGFAGLAEWRSKAGPRLSLTTPGDYQTIYSGLTFKESFVTKFNATGGAGVAWRSAASAPETAVSIISFTATPTNITAGQTATLTPVFDNATTATIFDARYNGMGTVVSGGTYIVAPSSTTTYELVVDGTGGERVTRTVTVNVNNGLAQFLQQGPKLVATSAIGNAQQGRSVSLSADGNTAIIGGDTDNNGAGAAWVWTRSGGTWTQGTKLVGSDAVVSTFGSGQGRAVAISADGNTAMVGGWNDTGTWVFTRSGNVWTQQGPKLVPSGVPFFGFAGQGSSVALSADGNTAIIGGPLNNAFSHGDSGAWVWTRSGGVWTQQGPILVGSGSVGDARQGSSVSISADGNTAIVGGDADNNYVGAAWFWTRSGGVWTQQGPKRVGSGAVGGTNGGNGTVLQGSSVSLSADGNTALVGGQADGVLPSNNTGAVWVWTRSGGVWTQQGTKLVGPGGVSAATVQGFSVSLSADGNMALVGGVGGFSQTSSALVWTRSGGVWTHKGTKLVGSGAVGSGNGQQPAVSVSLSADGNTAIVGGFGDNRGAGATWFFTASAPTPPPAPAPYNISINSVQSSMPPSLPSLPSSFQIISLQINDGANIIRDADVRIESRAYPLIEDGRSDGHDHFDPILDLLRPDGTFERVSEPVGSDGVIRFKYTAPEVAGLIKATITCTTPSGGTCNPQPISIKVKIDSLQDLTANAASNFILIGWTTPHPLNHFGTPQLNQALIELADKYATTFPGSRLEYNDMSLRFGGLFDSDKEKPWRKPHAEHRLGLNLDLRVQRNNAVPPDRRLKLRQLIHKGTLGILIHPEGGETPAHWHLTFGDVKCIVEGGGPCTDGSVIRSIAGEGIARAAGAQTSAAGLTLHVTSAVTFNPATNLYTYTYSLRNDAASALEASSILIATGGSQVTNVQAPQGWTAALIDGRVAVEFAATEVGQLPANYVDDGNLVPSPFQIKPGQTLGGFSFQSPDPPGRVDFYAQGFKPIPTIDDESEGGPASDLDESFKGITTGPKQSNLKFEQPSYNVGEGSGRATLTVTRTGDTGTAETVAYQTQDTDTFTVGCFDTTNNHNGAFARCDFATVVGTLTFAPGETSKQLTVPIIDDGYAESAETFNVVLSNSMSVPLGVTASVTITDNDVAGAPNPIITAGPATYPFFVRQQYLDFLSREPEPSEPWTAVLNRCPNIHTPPSTVTDCDRIAVSGAFFRSPENSIKGFYVFRFYKVAFNRLPQYGEIVADMSFVAGTTEAEVYARKAQLATAFAARTEFTNAYSSKTNAEYVAALLARYQLASVTTPNPAVPDGATKINLSLADLVNGLNAGTLTRVQVLRAIADSDQVGTVEYNSAFVASQYYGYLRRTPEDSGYQAWLRVINQDPNNVRIMVNGFLNSTEYRLRFGAQ
jgi:Calx-beta domain